VFAAVLAIAAAAGSGLLAEAGSAYLPGASLQAWPRPGVASYVTLALLLLGYVGMRRGVGHDEASYVFPGIVLDLIALIGASGILISWGAGLAGTAGPQADVGALAALRTAVLAGMAGVFAWFGRTRQRSELVWATYLTLVIGGVKLMVDDVPNGRALTLCFALVAYGGALIVAPRLVRKAGRAEPGAQPVR
jgi:hypothetical protein